MQKSKVKQENLIVAKSEEPIAYRFRYLMKEDLNGEIIKFLQVLEDGEWRTVPMVFEGNDTSVTFPVFIDE
jgi:hypothetical protein